MIALLWVGGVPLSPAALAALAAFGAAMFVLHARVTASPDRSDSC